MKTVPMFSANDFSSREVLLSLLRSAPITDGATGAYTAHDVHQAVKVMTKLEGGAPDDPLVLEDAEHLWLAARLNKQAWRIATPEIAQLLSNVDKAEAA